MALKSVPFAFRDGKTVNILPETWDVNSARAELQDSANKQKFEDETLGFFAREIYPSLAGCADTPPTLEEAYALDPLEWDAWWFADQKVVPNWFTFHDRTEELVKFTNGKTLTVQSIRPSVIMRRIRIENEVKQLEVTTSLRKEVFKFEFYPKLAGCSVGDVPSLDFARGEMPIEDLNLWYAACRNQLPSWFLSTEEAAELAKQTTVEDKKKRRKRARR